jgi:hypothetical protein
VNHAAALSVFVRIAAGQEPSRHYSEMTAPCQSLEETVTFQLQRPARICGLLGQGLISPFPQMVLQSLANLGCNKREKPEKRVSALKY